MTARLAPTRPVQGLHVPSFMYGTAWKEERTRDLVLQAFDAGFRAIDTANQRRHYVEAAVGEAVAELLASGRCERKDLFLQTKYTYARGQDHRLPYDPRAELATQVRQSFDSSLEHLGTSYLDSLVLHGPATAHGLTEADLEVWSAMEALVHQGHVRLLGASNVSLQQLARLSRVATVPIAFVQNRCFARTGWDRGVRSFCLEHGIVYQGFSLLTANERELRSPAVRRIAERHQKTVAQITFRFALEVGMLPLTGSSSAPHLTEDLGCFDFELEPHERETLDHIGG